MNLRAFKKYIIDSLSKIEWIKAYYRGYGLILMLHRIAPINPRKLPINEALKVSPEFLESFIIESKKQGYYFISLDELCDDLTHNRLKSKFLCITIDDGYKDNLQYGYPIFHAYNVPFCIYVCTSFPESSHNMWWFGLEDYLLDNDTIDMPNGGGQREIRTLEQKQAMFLSLRETIIKHSSSYTDANKICQKLGIYYNPQQYNDLTLSWKDIEFLDKQNLATIGNHTHTHPIFNNLTTEQVALDIKNALALFATHKIYPKHFGYPFGGRIEVSSKYFTIPQTLGFSSATTTRHGSIFPKHKNHLYALPRVMISDNFMLDSAFRVRKKRIVVD